MYQQHTATTRKIGVSHSSWITVMQWNPRIETFVENKEEILRLSKTDKLTRKEIHSRMHSELGICYHTFCKYFNRYIVRGRATQKRTLKRPADKQAAPPTSKRSEDARLNADTGKPSGTDDDFCKNMYRKGDG